MAEENKMPALEAIAEEESAEQTHQDFDKWHEGHMERVKEGLQTIIASDDLAEIKEIASINIFFNTLVRYPISITKLSLPLFYMLVL